MVIFSLAIMGVLVLIIVNTSDDDRLGSRYDFEGTRSFYAAEAGVNSILTNWKANWYEATVPNVGNTNVLAWQTLPQGGGTYRATILKVDNSTYMITVDGQSPGARKGLRTVQVMLTPGPGPFNYAIVGGSSVTISGGTVNSFNSDSGAYGGTNIGSNGDIQSNGSGSKAIDLSGGTINGDATAVGSVGGTKGCAVVTGTCSGGQTAVPIPPVSCPASFSPASQVPVSPSSAYDQTTGKLSMSAGNTLTLNSAYSPFSFGDVTLKAPVIIPAGSDHIDIYISGLLSIPSGGLINNQTQDATKLTIWGCGTSTANWAMTAGSNSYFAVYAPNHPVAITGSGAVYGAVVGSSVSMSGGGGLHYDEALASVPSVVLIPGSWTEITR
jgi:hypothetical protein